MVHPPATSLISARYAPLFDKGWFLLPLLLLGFVAQLGVPALMKRWKGIWPPVPGKCCGTANSSLPI
ncbi:MAG: hypothetical protein R3E95_19225 [Thiolinea sp.]